MSDNSKVIIAITGASGVIYGKNLFDYIHSFTSYSIGIIISDTGKEILESELGIDEEYFKRDRVTIYDNSRIASDVASGSNAAKAMVIIPSSMNSLSRVANGISYDLIGRTADVMLKERRRLILVPRETPVSGIHLTNMLAITRAGGIIAPASPGFYNNPSSIDDLANFITAKILNLLGIKHSLLPEWKPL